MFLPTVYDELKPNSKTKNQRKSFVSGWKCATADISIGCTSHVSCVDGPCSRNTNNNQTVIETRNKPATKKKKKKKQGHIKHRKSLFKLIATVLIRRAASQPSALVWESRLPSDRQRVGSDPAVMRGDSCVCCLHPRHHMHLLRRHSGN